MNVNFNRITKELYEISEQLKTLDKEIENLKTIEKVFNHKIKIISTGDSETKTQQESV